VLSLFLVEHLDVRDRLVDRLSILSREHVVGVLDLALRDADRVSGDAVERLREVEECLVAVFAYARDDLGDRLRDFLCYLERRPLRLFQVRSLAVHGPRSPGRHIIPFVASVDLRSTPESML